LSTVPGKTGSGPDHSSKSLTSRAGSPEMSG